MNTILIVGASLAGLRAAETLRRRHFTGTLVLAGDEPHLPYDRPPLSKQVLTGAWDETRTALRRKPYEALQLDLKLGHRAKSLDVEASQVHFEDRSTVGFDGLVIATGARARTLPNQQNKTKPTKQNKLSNVFTLRTLDDTRQLRHALASQPTVVILGAGFIGAEVASSARDLGCDVTVLEAQSAPLVRGLGEELGHAIATRMQDAGVTLRCNAHVAHIQHSEDHTRAVGVVLEDGKRIPCDVLLVAIGSVPNTAWLHGSGLALDHGVVCDEHLNVFMDDNGDKHGDKHGDKIAKHIVAIGDVARFYNPRFKETMRLEHWTHAVESARTATDTLLHGKDAAPYHHIPSFWSDQFGIKIQGAGRPSPTDTQHIAAGTLKEEKFAVIYGRDNQLTGVVAFNMPPQVIRYQRMLAANATWQEALDASV